MDFDCLEALLGLPEFRVIDQVLNPQQLDLHLERRDTYLVCPRCQGCCSQISNSRYSPGRLSLHLNKTLCGWLTPPSRSKRVGILAKMPAIGCQEVTLFVL